MGAPESSAAPSHPLQQALPSGVDTSLSLLTEGTFHIKPRLKNKALSERCICQIGMDVASNNTCWGLMARIPHSVLRGPPLMPLVPQPSLRCCCAWTDSEGNRQTLFPFPSGNHPVPWGALHPGGPVGTLRCLPEGRRWGCLVNAESWGPQGGGGWQLPTPLTVSKESRLFHSL